MQDAHWRPPRRVLGSPPGLDARAGDVLEGRPAPPLPETPLSRPGPAWCRVRSALEESPRRQSPAVQLQPRKAPRSTEGPLHGDLSSQPSAGRRGQRQDTVAHFSLSALPLIHSTTIWERP
ncbi:hypothetical protein H8959_007955 [Pygathrix nigripes]